MSKESKYSKEIEEINQRLKKQYEYAIAENQELNDISWGMQEGCLISYNDCKLISEALSEKEEESKWISVYEKLPELPSENYLVIVNGFVEISLFRGDHKLFQTELHNKNKVTHWQNLPTPPSNNH